MMGKILRADAVFYPTTAGGNRLHACRPDTDQPICGAAVTLDLESFWGPEGYEAGTTDNGIRGGCCRRCVRALSY